MIGTIIIMKEPPFVIACYVRGTALGIFHICLKIYFEGIDLRF